jgi:hypothetical protein
MCLTRHGQSDHHIAYYHKWSYANTCIQWWSSFLLEDHNVVYLVECATSSLECQMLFQWPERQGGVGWTSGGANPRQKGERPSCLREEKLVCEKWKWRGTYVPAQAKMKGQFARNLNGKRVFFHTILKLLLTILGRYPPNASPGRQICTINPNCGREKPLISRHYFWAYAVGNL